MKGIVAIFVLFCALAHAGEPAPQAESALLKFHPSSQAPRVGESYTLLIQADSGFTKNEVVLETYVDGIRKDALQSGTFLWALELGSFGEVRDHLVLAKAFVRNEREANRIRAAIQSLDQEIVALEAAIAAEQDEAKRDQLIASRDRKLAYKEKLEDELEGLKVFFKEESFAFQIAEDSANPNFPFITGVAPNLGFLAGGTRITISGTNFPAGPVVKIGTANASLISATSTEIQALSPAFAQSGIKDVVLEFPSVTKNAVKKNAFFVTTQAPLPNFRPVANATGFHTADWPVTGPVTLNGSTSYDINSDSYDYLWKVLIVPTGASLTPGSFLANTATPSFTPNKKGPWVFELKLREQSTPERLESLPIQITVEVGK